MAVVSSPSSPALAPEKTSNWLRRGNKKLIGRYLGEARAALAAAMEVGDGGGGDDAAAAALGLAAAALELSPRMEAALELRARALLALRRYRDVADMLRYFIPSCAAAADAMTSSSSSSYSGGDCSTGLLLSPGFVSGAGSRFLCCFDIKRRLFLCSRGSSSNGETEWRYLVLGQACFHLGLMEDAAALLQTGRRLASAAFRRQSVSWSDDTFSPNSGSNTKPPTSSSPPPAPDDDAATHLLAHVKLLLRRRAAGMAALDAGLPAEAARHFSKILGSGGGGAPKLPHSFAAACLVSRAAAFSGAGKAADAIADCNRALALDPAYIPALRARADLLESVNAVAEALRDMDHLKLLYDAALRDGKLPGPPWRPQGGVRHGEIAVAHRALVARIRRLRGKLAAGEAGDVDYYLLLGLRRPEAGKKENLRPEVVRRAFVVMSMRMKPEEQWRRTASFAERVELVDEFRDMDAVRDQARMSGMFLYRMVQKGYAHVMAAVVAAADEEEEERRRRVMDAAAAAVVTELSAAAAGREEEEATEVVMTEVEEDDDVSSGNVEKGLPEMETRAMAVAAPAPETRVMTAAPAVMSPVFQQQGAFCRDMAVVGTLLSRGGGMEAMSC